MFNRDRLTIRKLTDRKSKTTYESVSEIPKINQKDQLKFVDELVAEINEKKKVIIGFGGHFIKNKCQQQLIELIDHNYITHIVTNGASTIHDFEFGYYGHTEEDVRENLANGTFGLWETSEHINKAINMYGYMGYGKSIGKYIDIERTKSDDLASRSHINLAWQCFKKDIPLSICTSIGHDIIYEHPLCDGARIGQASYKDFLNYASTMEGIENAVFICVGSAITFPMVTEKAFAMAKNVSRITGNNCSCYVVDLFDDTGSWNGNEPVKDDPTYFIRPLKTFNRMFPNRCKYIKLDNRQLMNHLTEKLI